jgi:hypothetical protein
MGIAVWMEEGPARCPAVSTPTVTFNAVTPRCVTVDTLKHHAIRDGCTVPGQTYQQTGLLTQLGALWWHCFHSHFSVRVNPAQTDRLSASQPFCWPPCSLHPSASVAQTIIN